MDTQSKQKSWRWLILLVIGSVGYLPAQETSTVSLDEERDYYYDGEYMAESEYSGNWASLTGLASGAVLGPVGWGLGYAIASNMEIDVARRHTSGLTRRQRSDFNLGYKDYVRKKRRRRFS
ncbi:MAG: hypothetical protein V3W14_10905, partial [Candidatus Neomarinimicrobiota bacterium]